MTAALNTKKVATLVGRAGMCSDDGRAITYYWQVQTNDNGGRGWYSDPQGCFDTEDQARAWAAAKGYEVTERAVL